MGSAAVAVDVRSAAYQGLVAFTVWRGFSESMLSATLASYLSGKDAIPARPGFNERALAAMLASHLSGESAMPARLGLDTACFAEMLDFHFPGYAWPAEDGADEWDASSMPEYGELKALLLEYAAPHVAQQPWWIELVIAGCAGRDHMWRDMGLFERRDLSLLLQENFPRLAVKNGRDMKWKKFIYKQLCEREGIIACPAPSCEACASFSECFAPEDD